MEEINVIREPIYEKAIHLLNESETLALSIVDEDSYPQIYPMEKVISENLDKIIFITKKDSNKVRLLNISNKCCVEVHTKDDMICLRGKIEIYNSEEQKKQLLPKDYIERLEHSGSHQYCILIFNTFKASLYIDGELENFSVK